MIRLLEHGLCTGCGACAAACPMGAIRMEEQGGFPFPAVGQNCTDCGKCMQVCGRRILSKSAAPLAAWRLNSRDTALRFKSSSGGFFGEAARLILSEGGCVFGAAWGEGCFSVSHRKAESPGELEGLLQSKYVQSGMSCVYAGVRAQLDAGREVLFCGTPCQVAALKAVVREQKSLIAADLICYGINSQYVYKKWLTELEGKRGSKISRVWFRHKLLGWKKSGGVTKLCFRDGTEALLEGECNLYMRGFLEKNLFIRECCSRCQFKGRGRASDVTIGDSWGMPAPDDGGSSLVIANSTKGKALVEKILPLCEQEEVSFEAAVRGNPAYYSSVERSPYAEKFIAQLADRPFSEAVAPYLDDKAEYLIFGAGALGELALGYYTKVRKVRVAAFLDNSPAKAGGSFCGLPVYKPESLRQDPGRYRVVIALKYPEAAAEQLAGLGIHDAIIFRISEVPA